MPTGRASPTVGHHLVAEVGQECPGHFASLAGICTAIMADYAVPQLFPV